MAAYDDRDRIPGDEPAPEEVEHEEQQPPGEEPAAAPEETEPQPEGGEHQQGVRVPLSELQKERERRRELERAVQQQQQRYDDLQKMAERFMQGRSGGQDQTQPQAEKKGDEFDFDKLWNEDPATALRTKLEREEAERKRLEEKISSWDQQNQQTSQQQQQLQQLVSAVQEREHQFMQEAPDYMEAHQFWRNKILRDLQRYEGLNEVQARQRLPQVELSFAANHLRNGNNPAEIVYQWAQEWGYQPGGQAGGATQPSQANGAAQVQQQTPSTRQIDQTKRHQATRSLGQATGGAVSPTSLKDISSMSETEFDKWRSSVSDEEFFAIMARK